MSRNVLRFFEFQSLFQLLWKKCKCHGLSGSCAMKTCWMQQPDLHKIGDYIKEKYDSSVEMTVKLNRRGKKRLKPKYSRFKKPSPKDLIYYETSPNFCDRDSSLGSLGTSGRVCNISSSGIDGCELLCCGRGHNIQQAKISRNCNCIFLWCCEVKCDKCKEIVNIYTCKWRMQQRCLVIRELTTDWCPVRFKFLVRAGLMMNLFENDDLDAVNIFL